MRKHLITYFCAFTMLLALSSQRHLKGFAYQDSLDIVDTLVCTASSGCAFALHVDDCPNDISKLTFRCEITYNGDKLTSNHHIDHFLSKPQEGVLGVKTAFDISQLNVDAQCYLIHETDDGKTLITKEDGSYLTIEVRQYYTPNLWGYSSHDIASFQDWAVFQSPKSAPSQKGSSCVFTSISIDGRNTEIESFCNTDSHYGWYQVNEFATKTTFITPAQDVIPKVNYHVGAARNTRLSTIKNWDQSDSHNLRVHPTLNAVLNSCEESTNAQFAAGGNKVVLTGSFGQNLDKIKVFFSEEESPNTPEWLDRSSQPQKILVEVPNKPSSVQSNNKVGAPGLSRTVKTANYEVDKNIDTPEEYFEDDKTRTLYFDHVGSFADAQLKEDEDKDFEQERYCTKYDGWFTAKETGKYAFTANCDDYCELYLNTTPDTDFDNAGASYADYSAHKLQLIYTRYKGIFWQANDMYKKLTDENTWGDYQKTLNENETYRITGIHCQTTGGAYANFGFIFDGDSNNANIDHHHRQPQVAELKIKHKEAQRQTWRNRISCASGDKFKVKFDTDMKDNNGNHIFNTQAENTCPPNRSQLRNNYYWGWHGLGWWHFDVAIEAVNDQGEYTIDWYLQRSVDATEAGNKLRNVSIQKVSGDNFSIITDTDTYVASGSSLFKESSPIPTGEFRINIGCEGQDVEVDHDFTYNDGNSSLVTKIESACPSLTDNIYIHEDFAQDSLVKGWADGRYTYITFFGMDSDVNISIASTTIPQSFDTIITQEYVPRSGKRVYSPIPAFFLNAYVPENIVRVEVDGLDAFYVPSTPQESLQWQWTDDTLQFDQSVSGNTITLTYTDSDTGDSIGLPDTWSPAVDKFQFAGSKATSTADQWFNNAGEITITATHLLAGSWVAELDTCQGRVKNVATPHEVNLSIDSAHFPSDLNNEITEIVNGSVVVLKTSGSPKNQAQADKYGFTLTIDSGTVSVIEYIEGQVKVLFELPEDNTSSFTITFSGNGKSDTKTFTRGNEDQTFTVTDPEVNEYEQKDVTITLTGITLSDYSCDQSGPGSINDPFVKKDDSVGGLIVEMHDTTNSSNIRPLRITKCPSADSIIARYPKAAPSTYNFVVRNPSANRRLALANGGTAQVSVGVIINSISPTSGNGGIVTINASRLPQGGAGDQGGVHSEYLAYVGDKNVSITKVDYANGEVDINIPPGLHADGAKKVCLTIDLVGILCEEGAKEFTFDSGATDPSNGFTATIDNTGANTLLTVSGSGLNTDASSYTLYISNKPLQFGLTTESLIESNDASTIVVRIPYAKNGKIEVTFGPLPNGSFIQASEDADPRIVSSLSGPSTDVSEGGATVSIAFRNFDPEWKSQLLLLNDNDEDVTVNGTVVTTHDSYSARLKAGTDSKVRLVRDLLTEKITIDDSNSLTLTKAAQSPTITSVAESSGTVTISGENFGTIRKVYFNGSEVAHSNASGTGVEVSLNDLEIGEAKFDIEFEVTSNTSNWAVNDNASFNAEIDNNTLGFSGYSGAFCSGGARLDFTSSRLQKAVASGSAAILVGDIHTKAQKDSNNDYYVELPQLLTTALAEDNTLAKAGAEILYPFKITTTNADGAKILIDGKLGNTYTPDGETDELVVDLVTDGSDAKALITEIRYYYNHDKKSRVKGNLVVSGQNGSGDWTEIEAFNGNAIRENFVNFVGTVTYQRIKFTCSNVDACKIGEIVVKGHIINDSDISIKLRTRSTIIDTGVTFSCETTIPKYVSHSITRNKPAYDGNNVILDPSGSDTITFTFDNLDATDATAWFGHRGLECTNSSVSGNTYSCQTVEKTGESTFDYSINIGGKGNPWMQTRITYGYLFSDADGWGGTFGPQDHEMVYVPPAQALLLDQSTPSLSAILIEGLFIVKDLGIGNKLTIDASYIMIHKGGVFQAGTQDNRYQGDLVITMHATRQSAELPQYGNKVIGIRDGELQLNGRELSTTWADSDRTIEIGSKEVFIKADVVGEWKKDDEIVVASSDFNSEHAERRFISSVESVGTQQAPVTKITVTENFDYRHFSGVHTGTDENGNDHEIELRFEVGLLTRNIVYQGEPIQSAADEYGAHIMFSLQAEDISVGDATGDLNSAIRVDTGRATGVITYIELRFVGQAFQLGRYPIHYHMLGNVSDSLVEGNAIHDTYNRAVTFHHVKELRVRKNVAYRTMGHTFFIEDAVEEQNHIEYNLGVDSRRSWSLLNTDQTPATFWITNPNNNFIGNRAAGSHRYGYWFDHQVHPTGLSPDACVWVEALPLGTFRDNQAHSNGRYGLRIFHNFVPLELQSEFSFCDAGAGDFKGMLSSNYGDETKVKPISAVFENFTGYRNGRNGIIFEFVGDVQVLNAKVADNVLAGIEYSIMHHAIPDNSIDSHVKNSVVFGHTNEFKKEIEDYLITENGVSLFQSMKDAFDAGVLDQYMAKKAEFQKYTGIGDEAFGEISSWRHYTRCLITPKTEFFVVDGLTCVDFQNVVNTNNNEEVDFAQLGSCSHCFHPAATDSGARLAQFKNFSGSPDSIRFAWQHPVTAIFEDIGDSLTLTGIADRKWATPYFQHLDFTGLDNEKCKQGPIVSHRQFSDGDSYFIADLKQWTTKRHSRWLHCDKNEVLRRLAFSKLEPSGSFLGMEMKIFRLTDVSVDAEIDGQQTTITSFINENYMDKEIIREHLLDTSFDEQDDRKHSVVHFKEKLDPSFGYATAFLLGQAYNIHWRYGMNFDKLEVWREKSQWKATDKPVLLQFNHTGTFYEEISTTFVDGETPEDLSQNSKHQDQIPKFAEDLQKDEFKFTSYPDWQKELSLSHSSGESALLNGATFNDYFNYRTSLLIAPPAADEEQGNDKFQLKQLRCASFETCNPGLFTGEREGVYRNWNGGKDDNVGGWTQLDAENPLVDYPVTQDRENPLNGKLTILPNWKMLLNTNAVVEELEILGELKVQGATQLTVNRIYIGRLGEFKIGTKESPNTNFRLIFKGDRDSTVNTGNPDINLGTKGIANFGLLSVYGSGPSDGKQKQRLQSSLSVGGTEITVEDASQWNVDQTIGVGPTGFSYEEYEEFVIVSKSGNTLTVKKVVYENTAGTLNVDNSEFTADENADSTFFARITKDEGAASFHFGGNDSVKVEGLDPRAEVVLLSRGVQFIGTPEDRWGAQITTSEEIVKNEEYGDQVYKGTTILSHVELQNFGQADLDHAGVRFASMTQFVPVNEQQHKFHLLTNDSIKPHISSVIENCSFNRGWGWGINVNKVNAYNGLYIFGNTIFDSTAIGIQVTQSNNVWVHDNWVIGNKDRQFVTADGKATDAYAGFSICARQQNSASAEDHCEGVKLTDNVSSGSADLGFIVPAHEISNDQAENRVQNAFASPGFDATITDKYPFSTKDIPELSLNEEGKYNEVSAQYQAAKVQTDYIICEGNEAHANNYGFVLQRNDSLKSKIAEVGYLRAFKSKIVAAVAFAHFDEEAHFTQLTVGYSYEGISINMSKGENDDENSVNTSVLRDSIVVGDLSSTDAPQSESKKMIGILQPSSNLARKQWPPSTSQLPWPKIKGNSKLLSHHYGYRLTFKDFPQGTNVFHDHTYNSDIVPTFDIHGLTLRNVHRDAVAYFFGWRWSKATIDNCGLFPCTGPDNQIISVTGIDDDNNNSAFTGTDHQLINANSTAALNIESCTQIPEWGRDSIDLVQEHYTKTLNQAAPVNADGDIVVSDSDEQTITKAHLCANPNIDLLTCDSRDGDRFDRALQPIYVTSDDENKPYKTILNAFEDHVWDGFYTGQLRQSTFPVVVETTPLTEIANGVTPINYIWEFAGTPPGSLDFFFGRKENYHETPTARGALITIDYPKAGKYKVTCGDHSELIELDTSAQQQLADKSELDTADYAIVSQSLPLQKAGEYRWVAKQNILQFYGTNEAKCEVRYINSLQISARLDITMSEFFSDSYQSSSFKTRFAASINVKPWQINILGIFKGSVIVIFEIEGDGSSADDQVQNLETIKKEIEEKIASGELDLGAPILDFSVEAAFEEKYLIKVETEDDSLSGVTIALIAVAAVLTIVAIVLLFICLKRKVDQKQVALRTETMAQLDKKDDSELPSAVGMAKDIDVSDIPEAEFIGRDGKDLKY